MRPPSASASSTTTGAETRLALPEFTLGVWHGYVPGVRPGQTVRLPGGRAVGPAHGGLVFNADKLLLDPYARAIDGAYTPSPTLAAVTSGGERQPGRLGAVRARAAWWSRTATSTGVTTAGRTSSGGAP